MVLFQKEGKSFFKGWYGIISGSQYNYSVKGEKLPFEY